MSISITVTILVVLAFAPADNAVSPEFTRHLNASGELWSYENFAAINCHLTTFTHVRTHVRILQRRAACPLLPCYSYNYER